MQEKSTKQRILEVALSLFSKEGYHSTSVAMIAEEVGIKAPSLYKHYDSKQAILDAIVEEMGNRYNQMVNTMQMDGSNPNNDMLFFETINEEQLITLGSHLFKYFLHDPFACQFRKLLTIEQYRDTDLAKRYIKQYIQDPLAYQSSIFNFLSTQGVLLEQDAYIMALHFYSPIFTLLTLCDHQSEKEEEILTMVINHIKQFNSLYKNKGVNS